MTYAERLAEFVKVTGHKPGEMNKVTCANNRGRCSAGNCKCVGELFPSVSLEPASQSAGPGSCNRFTRDKTGESYSVPCKLPANHEGPHEP